ncbi:SRA stem-loop-interacting RNA-binding protein, mitochondrial [Anguilla rostrata]|uniref:SRA stem-loop-interacting RNA-binding protein, mitochondrial n=1 Tax=Anguilla rostrata TaxID=7938 RepID=UPI0030CC8113
MAAHTKKAFEIFVSKIPWTLASKEMREYFGQFGQVRKCVFPFDRETGFHRGFCRVVYGTEEGLQNALQKEAHIVEGSRLHVQLNRTAPRRSRERDDS